MTGSPDLINREIVLLIPVLPLLLATNSFGEPETFAFASEPETAQEPESGPEWKGNLNFGLTYLSGNSNSATAALSGRLAYDAEMYKWLFTADYAGVRTEDPSTGDSKTTSRLYASGGQYNRFMDEEKNLFFYGKASARKDIPVGLEMRWDAGIGAGYTWYLADDEKKTFFSLEGGPSFVHEENVGAAEESDAANARVAARYGNPLWDEWMLTASTEYFISLDDTEDQSLVAEMNMDWMMNENWKLAATVAVAWDNTPSVGFDSTDRRFVISLGREF
jgi:putative salt-induced outer membrane protein YdiY